MPEPKIRNRWLIAPAAVLMQICLGAVYGWSVFGVMPSFAVDFFGSKFMGGIYGWIPLAWGAGAIPSPIRIARVRENTGVYAPAIRIIAIVMLIAPILPTLARLRDPSSGAARPGAPTRKAA